MGTEKDITWHELQEVLRNCTTEDEVQKIIDKELAGPKRARWVIRAAGRRRVLRNERENAEIVGATGEGAPWAE